MIEDITSRRLWRRIGLYSTLPFSLIHGFEDVWGVLQMSLGDSWGLQVLDRP